MEIKLRSSLREHLLPLSAKLVALTICLAGSPWSMAMSDHSKFNLVPGQAASITLDQGSVDYWEAPSQKPTTLANLLITHDVGLQFNSAPLMQTLIREFAERGYRVVSIATPQFPSEQINSAEAVQKFEQLLLLRLNGVVNKAFSDARYKRFIISHGQSSYWLGKLLGYTELKVHGFAAISTYFPDPLTNDQIPKHLAKLNCFVLDIYAAQSPLWVLKTAQARRAFSAPRRGLYRQFVIENANHHFYLSEKELANRLDGWMRSSLKEVKGKGS